LIGTFAYLDIGKIDINTKWSINGYKTSEIKEFRTVGIIQQPWKRENSKIQNKTIKMQHDIKCQCNR